MIFGSVETTKPPSPAAKTFVACKLTTRGISSAVKLSNPAALSITTSIPVSSLKFRHSSELIGRPNGETGIIANGSPSICERALLAMSGVVFHV